MSGRFPRRLQCAAACVLIGAYAGLSHYCNALGGAPDLGTILALGPVTAFFAVLVWRCTPLPAAILLSGAVVGALYGLWPLLRHNFSLLALADESGVYILLGTTFGRSLLPGRTALCTTLADKVHGPLAPREVRYTRQVTGAWALFFFAIAAVSILLFVSAPLRIWSIYINFCVLPLVAGMFTVEYTVRQRVLPRGRRVGLLATVRVYLATPQ